MSALLRPEVEALVRAHAVGNLPNVFREPLTEDYPACVEVGLIDPMHGLVADVLAWARREWAVPDEPTHDTEAV